MEAIALNGFSLDVISFMQSLERAGASTVHLLMLMAVHNFVLRLLSSNYILKIYLYSKRGVKPRCTDFT